MTRSMRRYLSLLALASSNFLLQAAPILSGVSFFGATANGNQNGQYWGYSLVQVWLQENGSWITTSGGQVNLPLTNGTHTFNFYASGNGIVIGQAGVNITLGSTCTSGISVLGSSGSSSFTGNSGSGTYWPASSTVPSCNLFAPGSGSLSWSNGIDNVTLTQFAYLDHLSSGVNLINYLGPNPNGSPDGIPDHFGSFTLVVNADAGGNVPEPHTWALLTVGFAFLGIKRGFGRRMRR